MTRRRLLPLAALALCVAGVAVPRDARAATTIQEVRGSVKIGAGLDGLDAARRAYVASDGDVNGVTGYVFELDPSTVGGRFSLKVISGLTAPDRVWISFLESLESSVNCGIGGPGDTSGVTCGAYAVVWMQTGTQMAFLYTAEPGPCGAPRFVSPVTGGPGLSPTGDDATATQGNPAHSGSSSTSLAPPLRRNWALDFNGPVGEPIVAGSRIFVAVGSTGGGCLTRLFVVSLRDGTQPWGPVVVPGGPVLKLTYAGGTLFVLSAAGVVQAYRASDGVPLWSIDLPVNGSGSGMVAANGLVYVVLSGQVRALSPTTGDAVWQASYAGAASDPAIASDGVFLTTAQGRVYRFDAATGAQVWSRPANGSSGGSEFPVVHADAVYDRNVVGGRQLVLDAGTGAEVTTFSADKPPAFRAGTGFFMLGSTLKAQDLATRATRWNFAGDGQLANGPLVGNGAVYVASAATVYALEEATGRPVWQEELGTTTGTYRIPGMALGNGFLVVPAGDRLIAYR